MGARALISNNSKQYFLEVVRTQVVFDQTQSVDCQKGRFKVIVNPTNFESQPKKEIAIAKVGLSDRNTLKFFFEKTSLNDSIREVFFHHPVFRVERNFVLPAELLIFFSLPYHIIEKGDYPIRENENYYHVEF